MGLLVAAVIYWRNAGAAAGEAVSFWSWKELFSSTGFESVVAWLAIPVAAFIAWYLIAIPLRKAGAADEPAPPTAIM